MSALNNQAGGDHYKSLAIQPVQYIQGNGLDYFQGNVIKYITRHKSKNGKEDILKAIHYCELILELQYSESIDNKVNEKKTRDYWINKIAECQAIHGRIG